MSGNRLLKEQDSGGSVDGTEGYRYNERNELTERIKAGSLTAYHYGREIGWVDYTNHGYGDINSPHYHTTPHWHEKVYNAQYPDGIKISYRKDVNTPLGDKQ